MRHFLGALIYQKDYQVSFRMIVSDCFGDFFDESGLPGLGRSDDQTALTLAYGGDQIDGCHLIRLGSPAASATTLTSGAIVGRARGSRQLHSLAQAKVLNQPPGNKHIFWRRQIIAFRMAKEAEPFFIDLKYTRCGLLSLHSQL